MHCPECGAAASENDLFCGECGSIMTVPVSSQSQEPSRPTLPPSSSAPNLTGSKQKPRAMAAFAAGLASLVSLALACLPLSLILSCPGPVMGIVAIVLGTQVIRDIDSTGGLEADRKRAQQGRLMGIVGVAAWSVAVVAGSLFIWGMDAFG